MGLGVTFCLICTAVFISAMRSFIPPHVRMIVYMVVIASFVIIVDRFIKASYPDISEAIGPYIGLIITNCILMGRAEAFAIKNGVYYSVLDGLGYGFGYTYTLIIFAVIREALGFGNIMGMRVMPHNWTNWVVMVMAPGAFFVLSLYLWIYKTIRSKK
jgi:Na+-transporting NADH:ubiquinone oxidoreductase subunit D